MRRSVAFFPIVAKTRHSAHVSQIQRSGFAGRQPGGNTGAEAGGWFAKGTKTPEDFQGLKVRMPGMGGHALGKMGAGVQNLPGTDVYRKLSQDQKAGKLIIWAAFAIVIMILAGTSFDLRVHRETVPLEDWVAFLVAQGAYHFTMFGILYACRVLCRSGILSPVVRETAKVTSMAFTILIGSQLLNLVAVSFGGEHFIQQVLRSVDNEFTVFLNVMLVLVMLDFLEIIYILGPVIYGGTFDPKWMTIMIAANLQTSFLAPPFGFALFYLRGVAPKEVTTMHIYRGTVPFVPSLRPARGGPAGPGALFRRAGWSSICAGGG